MASDAAYQAIEKPSWNHRLIVSMIDPMKTTSSLLIVIAFLAGIISCQHKNVHSTSISKDKKSQAELATGFERYVMRPQLIQNIPDVGDLNWGGFSGLRFIAKEATGDLLFWTITDRGPNGYETKKDGNLYRPFLMPSFHPSIVKIRTNKAEKTFEVIESLPLKNSTGEFLTGFPPENKSDVATKYEIAVDKDMQPLVTRGLGIDSESLTIDDKNHFWVGEEYLPSILEFDAQGTLLAHIQPAQKPGTKLQKNEIPYEYRLRKSNRGFEALAHYKDRIYFMTQSPLGFETKPRFIRVGVFNKKTRMYEAEYLYPVEGESADKIGDMEMINEKQFYVIQQNGDVGPDSVHLVYKADLTKATNVRSLKLKQTIELLSPHAFSRHFQFIQKTVAVDLVKEGYSDYEKVEGLTIIDANTIAVINDNDFGVDGKRFIARPVVLGIFKTKN